MENSNYIIYEILTNIKHLNKTSKNFLDTINSIDDLLKKIDETKCINFVNELNLFLIELKDEYSNNNNISINLSKRHINSFYGYIMEKYDLEKTKNEEKENKKIIKEEFSKLYNYFLNDEEQNLFIKFIEIYDKIEPIIKHNYQSIDFKNLNKDYILSFIQNNDVIYKLGLFQQKEIKENKPKEIENEIIKKDLIFLEDLEENKEFNEILKIFHQITKPHLDSNDKEIDISEKEICILNAIFKEFGYDKYKELKIKWNPYVGLFIESKDGFDKDNQKLIMSHTDLVPTFQKLHQDIKDGIKQSGLTIGLDGLIRGSLDNTLTNAIVLKNFIDGKFESNVSILFDRGEESGIWGANNFHKENKTDYWYQIVFDNKQINFIKTNNPEIKKDLIVINTDVTMGYDTPYAFETKRFSKETNNKIKELFPNGNVSQYCYDDSSRTTNKENITMSYCIVVGTIIKKLDNNKYEFNGGCHSENTATTIDNILAYSKTFEPFVRAYGNEIKLELKKEIEYKELLENIER